MLNMIEYEILSRCLDDHCVSEKSDVVFICEQAYQFNENRMGSRSRAGVKLKCPVPLINKFWEEYDSSEVFTNNFRLKCQSNLKSKYLWHNECEKAYSSDIEFGKFAGIGPVFECSRVYSHEGHHIMFVSAWYDPKMGFAGFFYYQDIGSDDLEFKSKYICSVS